MSAKVKPMSDRRFNQIRKGASSARLELKLGNNVTAAEVWGADYGQNLIFDAVEMLEELERLRGLPPLVDPEDTE